MSGIPESDDEAFSGDLDTRSAARVKRVGTGDGRRAAVDGDEVDRPAAVHGHQLDDGPVPLDDAARYAMLHGPFSCRFVAFTLGTAYFLENTFAVGRPAILCPRRHGRVDQSGQYD